MNCNHDFSSNGGESRRRKAVSSYAGSNRKQDQRGEFAVLTYVSHKRCFKRVPGVVEEESIGVSEPCTP